MKKENRSRSRASQVGFMTVLAFAMILITSMVFSTKSKAADYYVDEVTISGHLEDSYNVMTPVDNLKDCLQADSNFDLTIAVMKMVDDRGRYQVFGGEKLSPGTYRLQVTVKINDGGHFDDNTVCEFDGFTYAKGVEGEPRFDSLSASSLTFTTRNTFTVTLGDEVYLDSYEGTLYLSGSFPKNMVRYYAEDENVKKVVALEGTKFPADSSGLFENFGYTKSFDLKNADTSETYDMSNMFYGCIRATSIDVRRFDTSRVQNMRAMFCCCWEVETLDVSHFDTSRVSDMAYMFECCDLSELDVTGFDTSNVVDMEGMFRSLGLTSLDLSSFYTANVVHTKHMFAYCQQLKTIKVSENWTMENVTNSEDMFHRCYVLVGGNGTKFSKSHVDCEYARIDKSGEKGYFTYLSYDKPVFTTNLEGFYYVNTGSHYSTTLQVQAKNVTDANSYDWFVITNAGETYSIEEAAARGWFALTSPQYTHQAHIGIMDAKEEVDGWYVYCVAKGPGGTRKSQTSLLCVSRKLSWFEFDIENFELLDNIYKDGMITGGDVKSWELRTAEDERYKGTLSLAYASGGTWPTLADAREITPGMTVRFVVDITLKMYSYGGYSFGDSFSGKICGIPAQGYKVTGGTADTSDDRYVLIMDYEIPIPKNGMMVYGFDREITEPVPGEQPATELDYQRPAVARNNKYVVTGLSWSPADEVFKNGKQYTLTIDLKAKENFGFYEENEFFINGNKMEVLELVKGKEGTAKVSYKFLAGTIPDTEVVITKQPRNWYGEKYGVKASFDVEATGEGLSYQWQYKKGNGDWTDWAVTTGDTANLKVTLNEKTEKYQIRCKITDEYEVTAYTNAVRMMLAENNPIKITLNPEDYFDAVIGKKAIFEVAATGGNLHYQWQWDKGGSWQNYEGATADTAIFKISVNETTLKRKFRCEVTDDEGNWKYSTEARMYASGSGSEAPTLFEITKQPEDWYGEYGKKASFSVEAVGSGELTYQWQYKKSGNWINYGVTTADTPNFKVSMNEKNVKWPIRCLITDGDGSTMTTREVWMKLKTEEPQPEPEPQPVAGGPVITGQPTDWVGTIGKKASFSVTATGNGLSYQWQYKKGTADWTNYAIATADTANFQVSMNEKNVKWTFRCVITDAEGKTAVTNEVRMYVKGEEPSPEPGPANGPVITGQPGDFTGKIGKKATFTVTATGEGLTYEWQVKKTGGWSAYTLAGYNTPTFQVSINDKTSTWTYRCVIRDAAGNEVATNEVHIYVEE